MGSRDRGTRQPRGGRGGPASALLIMPLLAALPALAIPARAAEEQRRGAGEQPYDAQTKAALQEVISSQLKAFEKDDAKAAEEFAAPAIKDRFPEPSQFLDMVKKDYGALIHPRSTQFVGLANSPHGPLQKMTVVAKDGTVWSAIYSFEKIDGQWRITGCGLVKDETQQEI